MKIHSFMQRVVRCLAFLQFVALTAWSQVNISCPPPVLIVQDSSTNFQDYWRDDQFLWDPVSQSNNLAESVINLSCNVQNGCTNGAPLVKYILLLDLDNNGVADTRIDSDSLSANGQIFKGNIQSSGNALFFDKRSVPVNKRWAFQIKTTFQGNNQWKSALIWRNPDGDEALPELPYGQHTITWIAKDNCGNTSNCQQLIHIKDGLAPVLTTAPQTYTLNGSAIGEAWFYASDFIDTLYDNYLPAGLIQTSLRFAGEGEGFPVQPNGMPLVSLYYNCNLQQLGLNHLEIWARDAHGNTTMTPVDLLVESLSSVDCGMLWTEPVANGEILTVFNEGMEGVKVSVHAQNSGEVLYQTITDAAGTFSGNLTGFSPFDVWRPSLNNDPLNGLNTWDLVLISRHILGTEPLNSGYKLLAADANRSGTITSFDIVTLRKLILGTYLNFPENTSWRFVHNFQDLEPYVFIPYILDSMFLHKNAPYFTGVKIGDVDYTAIPNNFQNSADRTNLTCPVYVSDTIIEAQATHTARFTFEKPAAGFQLTIQTNDIEILSCVIPGNPEGEYFNIVPTPAGYQIKVVCELPGDGFEITYRARRKGNVRQFFNINPENGLLFAWDGAPQEPVLKFREMKNTTAPQVEIWPAQPNPSFDQAVVPFYLPEPAMVKWTITHQTGATIWAEEQIYPAGHQVFALGSDKLKTNGVYFIRFQSGKDIWQGKFIRL